MREPGPHRVLLVGIGAVSPNGLGRERFWAATRDGVSGVASLDDLLDDPVGRDLPVRIGGRVRGLDEDRWIDAKDRRHVSRAVPLALRAASEALEDAGLDPRRLEPDVARDLPVLVGSGGGQLAHTEAQFRLLHEGGRRAPSVYSVPTATMGTLASEISMRFDLHGPSHVVTTGCTSSTDALGYALRQVRHGYAERVLVVGVDAPLTSGILAGFCSMRILTASWNEEPSRGSRPFSKDRDGFVLAEGAWALLVESETSAAGRETGAYCELAGYGATCDAYHRVSLEESGEEPARAMRLALEDAGEPAERVGYLAYHGTSTRMNDRIETRAVRRAFGRHADRLPGSSLKSMIGHPQGACGAAGVAATALALRDGFLPPTRNLDVPDPECDLDYLAEGGRHQQVEVAVCNCIAFGSKNAAVVLRRWATP